MILKFRDSEKGWWIYGKVARVTYRPALAFKENDGYRIETEHQEEIAKSYPELIIPFDEKRKNTSESGILCFLAIVRFDSGNIVEIAYNQEAYLCNDQGKTIEILCVS